MIDIDKVKSAFAATSKFCQKDWHKPSDGGGQSALCAASALVAFAGVHPDLIAAMKKRAGDVTGFAGSMADTFNGFIAPVLDAYYGIPAGVSMSIMGVFDGQENEWKGIEAVIALFENHNSAPVVPVAVAALAMPTGCSIPNCAVCAWFGSAALDDAGYITELFASPASIFASLSQEYFGLASKQKKSWQLLAAPS